MADARTIKIPDANGNLISYAIKDVRNKRTRENITSRLGNLSQTVAEQNLEKYGYEIGDYFNGPSGYVYTLADPNTFYGYNVYAVIGSNHLSIVVDTNTNVKWNNSNDTSSGYVGSNLHSYMTSTVLNNVKSDFKSLFGGTTGLEHLYSHQKLYSTGTGSWSWSADQYISALTSVQLYGSPICDMNFYHTGEGNKSLEVFQKFFYPEILGNQNTWLRSVASASCPAIAGNYGIALGANGASSEYGAVGLIIFH